MVSIDLLNGTNLHVVVQKMIFECRVFALFKILLNGTNLHVVVQKMIFECRVFALLKSISDLYR